MKFVTWIVLLLAAVCLTAFAASEDDNAANNPVRTFEDEADGVTCVKTDRDKDGLTDYILRFDSMGIKIYEELDFNYDGDMDDFYYYASGVLCRREIDTNYDKQVDVWVYIHEGVYIERYERDLDFDGKIDLVKDFAETEPIAESM